MSDQDDDLYDFTPVIERESVWPRVINGAVLILFVLLCIAYVVFLFEEK